MINSRTESIYKPETIRIVTNERIQKLGTRSNNQYSLDDMVEDFNEYYKIFQQRRLICEATACDIIATKELKIPIGIYGERVFFFCEKCIVKFMEVK